MEVMPVSIVDDVMIGRKAGALTGTIHRAYKSKVEEYIESHK
jgi:hypothetical protein